MSQAYFLLIFLGIIGSIFSNSLSAAESNRGKAYYKMCASCHGEDGEGLQNVGGPAIAGMEDWYLKNQLVKFKAGGRGMHADDWGGLKMRPMARVLRSDSDVDAVVAYVSSMKRPAVVDTLKGSPIAGESKFMVCQSCHGAKAEGNKTMNAPSLTHLNDWYLLSQLKNFKNKVRGGNPSKDPIGSGMVPMAQMLTTEKDMLDVIAYIGALR